MRLFTGMEAAHCVNPFLNFAWDLERIELSYCRDQIIPSPLGMRSYETINMSSPTLGTELFSNHQSIPISAEPCFLGSQVKSYKNAMGLCWHLLTIRNSFSHECENARQQDTNHMGVFGKYTRTNAARSFFKSVDDFQRQAVRDWNEFRNNVTLLYNMGFVGVCEDSSDGALRLIITQNIIIHQHLTRIPPLHTIFAKQMNPTPCKIHLVHWATNSCFNELIIVFLYIETLYFPLQFVVDSVYVNDTECSQREKESINL